MEARRLDISYDPPAHRRRRRYDQDAFFRYRYFCLCRHGGAMGRLQLATIVITSALMLCTLTLHFLVVMPCYGHSSWVAGPAGLALSLTLGLALAIAVLFLARAVYAAMAIRTMLPHRKNGHRNRGEIQPVLHRGSPAAEGAAEPGSR